MTEEAGIYAGKAITSYHSLVLTASLGRGGDPQPDTSAHRRLTQPFTWNSLTKLSAAIVPSLHSGDPQDNEW
ncbi:hypothetical protein E2C01_015097 [Portunus trituberculatus]|uniref:Uncharacterized protein n=1 Tax=Portunus trituberculatus TaxID=210409 RepID=A0A5B7DKF0_PORTR|nr:hypothetical protein [Portunus trituberculatus]